MSQNKVFVTIFTPTYNRDQYIMKLYASLLSQTVRDFEWIVVDQGNDRTEELIREAQKEAPFPVRYERLVGERGIARAFNRMVPLARGFLVFKVDDDDMLTPDAVEAILEMEKTLPKNGRYAGVSGLRQYPDGKAVGGEWIHKTEWVDCTNLERGRYSLMADMAEAYYLRVLKKYGPMPTVPGEYYTFEGILWDRIADAGKLIRWFNRKIYIAEYHENGATDSLVRARLANFTTYTIMMSDRMKMKSIPFLTRLKISCRYFEAFRKKGIPYRDVRRYFKGCRPLACAGYFGSLITGVFFPDKPDQIVNGRRV